MFAAVSSHTGMENTGDWVLHYKPVNHSCCKGRACRNYIEGAARVAVHVSLLACSRAEPALSFLREPHGCAGLFCMVVTHSDVS